MRIQWPNDEGKQQVSTRHLPPEYGTICALIFIARKGSALSTFFYHRLASIFAYPRYALSQYHLHTLHVPLDMNIEKQTCKVDASGNTMLQSFVSRPVRKTGRNVHFFCSRGAICGFNVENCQHADDLHTRAHMCWYLTTGRRPPRITTCNEHCDERVGRSP